MKEFHLSVVATSRNDNHGSKLLFRMQHFVNGFIAQCKKHDLHAELILVEWNPPENQKTLAEVLHFPEEMGPCAVRIIQVPKEAHETFENSDKLPLFQMIAKNVGIRRAQGKFILATNIDILFSDELIKFMRDQLKPGILYRADRFDVPSSLPETASFDEILSYCEQNTFRVNGRFGTLDKVNGKWTIQSHSGSTESSAALATKHTLLEKFLEFAKWTLRKILTTNLLSILNLFKRLLKPYVEKAARLYLSLDRCSRFNMHTNACGDFTLLSSDDWTQLRGYPEWPIFSWQIDSVLLYQAKHHKIPQMLLAKKFASYHIEHSSGYTPESVNLMYSNLQAKKIPYLDMEKFWELVKKMHEQKSHQMKVLFNDETWGLAHLKLTESWIHTNALIME
jgi:hypothetical protein